MAEKEKYVKALEMMVREIWDDEENIELKREALQAIVDKYVTERLDLDNLCTVVLADLPDGRLGEYNHATKEARIRRDIAQYGMEKTSDGEWIFYERPVVDLVFQACHEARHSEQHYELENPNKSKDEKRYLLLQCNNTVYKGQGRVYFRATDDEVDEQIALMASCLYVLQPVERDAFKFAQRAADIFCAHMHRLFPDDPDFEYTYVNQVFARREKRAYSLFDSDNPIHDIDNIILTINGYFVEEPLNEIMCDIIKQTQEPFLYELLRENQERNREIIEKIERGKQLEANDEIYLDELDDPASKDIDTGVFEMYVDSANDAKSFNYSPTTHADYQEIDNEDQTQDISDRR